LRAGLVPTKRLLILEASIATHFVVLKKIRAIHEVMMANTPNTKGVGVKPVKQVGSRVFCPSRIHFKMSCVLLVKSIGP